MGHIHLCFIILVFFVVSTNCFPLEKSRLPGIWKLVVADQQVLSLVTDKNKDNDYEIIIKLNPDGTFKQCNEGYREGRWMSGRWKLTEGERLLLAMSRQYFGPSFDICLQGMGETRQGQLKVNGKVEKGKFMYPPNHPSFFDNTLIQNELLGSFTLEQVISTHSVQNLEEKHHNDDSENKYQMSDFHNQTFILTVEALLPKKSKEQKELDNLPVDIRSMPIQFHHNNTFQAWGINKILRGRFRITKKGELAFDVSLFGAGRSSPGSVFSEGLGLSHDDERSYRGSIQEKNGKLTAQGVATIGTDLGSDARPEPCGKFFLMQVADDDDIIPIYDSVFD